MGLDMYAFTMTTRPPKPIDFKMSKDAIEIHCWRKHPNQHGWMERLYRKKGGRTESFNKVNVQLTAADIDQLERDINARRLPPTQGFFFGESDGTEINDDLAFVAKAREALSAHLTVFYTSWW